RGRLPLLRGARGRRDHLRRLPDRPVRGGVGAGLPSRGGRGGGGGGAGRGAGVRGAGDRGGPRRLPAGRGAGPRAAGPRQGADRALQVPPARRVRRRAAEDRQRKGEARRAAGPARLRLVTYATIRFARYGARLVGWGRPPIRTVMLAMAALLATPGGALAASCGGRCHAVRAPAGIGGALAPGPGGSVWVAERGHLLRLGPRGGGRRVAAPVARGSDLAPAPGGSVWFAASRGRIGRATRSGRVTLFAAHVSSVGGLAAASGGGVWFTAPQGVGLLSAAGAANVVPVPGARPAVRRHAIATDSDGTPWFLLDSPS